MQTNKELALVSPESKRYYPFLYHIPENHGIAGGDYIHLFFHGSNIVDPEKGWYASETFEEQIEEHRERISRVIFPHMNGPYIYLFIIRPRNCTSDEYPMYLQDCQAFTREVMLPEFTDGYDDEYYIRPDLIIRNTVRYFREMLLGKGIRARKRMLISGGSAGAMTVNRFTFLHPDLVATAAILSAGNYQLPVASLNGEDLPYPFGVSQLEYPADLIEKLKAVQFQVYIGDQDPSDPLEYELNRDEEAVEKFRKILGASPYLCSQVFAKTLIDHGLNVRYQVFRDGGHVLPFKYIFPEIERSFEHSLKIG